VGRLTHLLERQPRWPAALGLAFGIYLLASLLWLAPLWRHLDSAVLDEPNDSVGALADYWAAGQLGQSPFTFDHNPYNGAPEGYPRSTTLVVANALQPLAFMALDGLVGDVGAWNVITISGFVLSALGMFALLWYLRLRLPTALLGGYVFGFGPWMFSRAYQGHGGMQHIWVLPLLFLTCLALHRSRRPVAAVAAGALVALGMYLHSYVGLMAAVVLGAFFLLELVVGRGILRTVALGALSVGTSLVLFSPPLWLYLSDRSGLSKTLAQPFSDLEAGGATLRDYLLPSDLHPVLGSLRPERLGGEHVLFWGYSLIVAAGVGAILVLRRRAPEHAYPALLALVVGTLGFLTSLKPVLDVAGVSLYTPSWLIGQLVTFWRAYARLGVVVALAMIVLAAFAFDALLSRRHGLALGAAATLLVGFELAVGAPVPIWRTDAMPPHVEWLRDHPGGIVAHYPLPIEAPGRELASTEYWNVTKHGHPLFALWGGNNAGTREEALRILAADLDNPRALRVLTALGVKYVVIHEDVYRALGLPVPEPGSVDTAPTSFSGEGKRILRPHAGKVNLNRLLREQSLRIAQARNFPVPDVEKSAGWNTPEQFHDGREWAWMIQGGRVDVRPAVDGPYYVVFDATANATPRTLKVRLDGREVGSTRVEAFIQRVRLGPFRFDGDSTLTLAAEPGPEPLGEGRVASVFVSPVELRPAPAFYGRLNNDRR
jgi:hypothetical protein